VWNRDAIVDIRLLGETPLGAAPTVQIVIDHTGVRARYQPQKQKFLGEDPVRVVVLGILGGLFAALVLPDFVSEPYSLVLGGFLAGTLTGAIGWLVVRTGRTILKLMN
jgi:hypothetical protein